MPSRRAHPVVWVLVTAVFAYSVVIASRALWGVLAGALVYLVGWLIGNSPPGFRAAFSRARALATGALVLLIVLYSLLIAGAVLLGVLTSLVVIVVSWATSPTGPVARWLTDRKSPPRFD